MKIGEVLKKGYPTLFNGQYRDNSMYLLPIVKVVIQNCGATAWGDQCSKASKDLASQDAAREEPGVLCMLQSCVLSDI